MAELLNRSSSAVLWGTAGSGLRIAIQMVAQITLARLLGPDQYGVFAMAVVVLSLGTFFADFGIAYGLIQKSAVSAGDIKFVVTWQVILGISVTTAILLLSDVWSALLAEPRLNPVLQVLAVSCFLNAITAPSINLLKRNLDFRTIQIAQLASYFMGYVLVGIPFALTGHQVWALVYAWLTQIVVNLAIVYWRTRHPVGLVLRHGDSGQMARYGFVVLVTNCVNWVIANVDRIIVARLFASSGVGVYATSYNLINTPAVTLLGVLQPALLSTAAKVQDDRQRLRRAFVTVAGVAALLVAPLFTAISVMADALVLTLYGPAWADAAGPLRALSLAMPFYILIGSATPILWTTGRSRTEFNVQLPLVVLWAGMVWLAAQHSVEAVAWSVLLLFVIRATVLMAAAMRAVEVSWLEMLHVIRGGIATSTVVAAAVFSTDYLVQQSTTLVAARLCGDVVAAALGVIVALVLARPWITPEVSTLVNSLLSRMPPPIVRAQYRFLGRVLK